MSRSHRGDNEPLGNSLRDKPSSYFASESALTSQKVTPEIIINLLHRVREIKSVFLCVCASVCSYFCFCVTRICTRWGARGGHPERERNKKKWRVLINQVKVQAVAAVAICFRLHVSRHLTLPSSSLLISSSSRLSSGLSTVSDEVCRYLSSNRSWSKACLCPCRQRD